jgi:hypothetical protein
VSEPVRSASAKRNLKLCCAIGNDSTQFLTELRENRVYADEFLLNEMKLYRDYKSEQEKALLNTILGAVEQAQSELSEEPEPKIIEAKPPRSPRDQKQKVKTPKMTEAEILAIIMGSKDLVKAIQDS